ncbi:helix-turn-helix domain-containing protein [Sphingoaurantiacus capsulatus]|uniref:Helix-turn-helix domain-containing protein n=1 Tax=Sphingoaurantiacus capsulatus TaxID=1771310 RepID=A0ABV7X8C1_9SPHN
MTTLKIGIMTGEQYKARTLAIARGEMTPGPEEPKVWFTSIESVAKVLSESNRALLAVIATEKPDSLKALADLVGRAPSNLTRTLRTMQQYGLVRLEPRGARSYAPRAVADRISVDLPLEAQAV